ncbi:MAG: transglycosylase SLT domain-containing protein [Candidatus Acidiferrales bacterium]
MRAARLCLALAISALPLTALAQQSAPPAPAGTAHSPSAHTAQARKVSSSSAHSPTSSTAAVVDPGQQLTALAHALHDHPSAAAYDALSRFAQKHQKDVLGARAALALGYYDLNNNHAADANTWLAKAAADDVLHEYVVYWQAETDQALGKSREALDLLQELRRASPDSAISEQIVESLADDAVAADEPAIAVAALDADPQTSDKSALLLLRAQAEEKVAVANAQPPLLAARDYLDIFYRFPLNEEAAAAGERLPSLEFALGSAFPTPAVSVEMTRAETLYLAHHWRDARSAYLDLSAKLTGSDLERAHLRVAECDVELGASPDALRSLTLTTPELDAERLYELSQNLRTEKVETEMLALVEQLAAAHPASAWTEQALFGTGNYYWVNLDRDHAATYYQRVVSGFPAASDAPTASWRLAWTAYLERKPEAAALLEDFARHNPTSTFIPDALYWLGRAYERSGDQARARSYYLAAAGRFPQNYFGVLASARTRPAPDGIGDAPVNPSDVLALIPPPAPLAPLDDAVPPEAAARVARAQALTSIAFDASAEIEYRAAYTATHTSRLLLDEAEAADAAGHYAEGMFVARQLVTQIDARRFSDVDPEAWRAAYPLPYREPLDEDSAANGLDPMLVAGLARQESAFDAEAISRTGAVGLMQIEPPTGRKLARGLHVSYSHARLHDPEYNLRLGSFYLANLLAAYGTPEAALAAYNAGEDRVEEWTAGQTYQETAEFVESIPFTETREYVQIVLRNANLYRQIYAAQDSTGATQNAAASQIAAPTPEKTP